jgi:hypothetical protein
MLETTNQPETNAAHPGWAQRHPRIIGALLLLVLHAAFVTTAANLLGLKPEAGPYLIGLVQAAYVVPTWILLMTLGRREMAKGMLFAALATFVVNAAGCAVFLWELSQIEG